VSTPRRGSSKRSSELSSADASDVEKLRKYHAELGAFLAGIEAEQSPAAKLSRHVRRHLPLYALAAVFALIVILIPTVNERTGGTTAGNVTGDNGAAATTDTSGGAASSGGSQPGTAGGSGNVAIGAPGSGGGGAGSVGSSSGPVAKVSVGTGVTAGGVTCRPGVKQVPWSLYANPCVAKFTGNNGGATYRGVDAKTIKIAIRHWAVTADDVTDAQNKAAGRQDRAGAFALYRQWQKFFEKYFELYGRKVQFVDFQSRVSNNIDEAQSKGQEGACADATNIAQSVKAFGDIGYAVSMIESQPFADCAKQQKIFVPFGASYFPEDGVKASYKNWDPYVWHVYMECTQIGHDVAEYIGKRLLGKPAKWAKDITYQKSVRKFGTYVPDNDGYQHCVNLTEQDLHNKYGLPKDQPVRFNYQLDVRRFPDQAEQGVIRFQAANVTTLLNACDTLSTRFLTEAADKQQWGPEWLIIGVALQDTDGQARTWNKNVVNGHLFGMSQLGQARSIEGTTGEAMRSWKTMFGSAKPPGGFGDQYYRMLLLYQMLQAAGPVLTPENIARGLRSLGESGGAHAPFGQWGFKGDHTAIDDSREIYWDSTAKGFDGSAGAYLEANGGRRYLSGEWPRQDPPIKPR